MSRSSEPSVSSQYGAKYIEQSRSTLPLAPWLGFVSGGFLRGRQRADYRLAPVTCQPPTVTDLPSCGGILASISSQDNPCETSSSISASRASRRAFAAAFPAAAAAAPCGVFDTRSAHCWRAALAVRVECVHSPHTGPRWDSTDHFPRANSERISLSVSSHGRLYPPGCGFGWVFRVGMADCGPL